MERSKDFVLERLYIQDKIILDKPEKSYTCGRGRENQIVCPSLLVSRKHCIFFRANHQLYITDLKSSNGIFINGIAEKSGQTIKLSENDIIGIGCATLNPNNDSLFAYKVSTMESPLPVESVDEEGIIGMLSKTVLNYNESLTNSASHTEHVLGEKCKKNINCDTVVPYKMQKCADNNNRDNNTDISKVNSDCSRNNQISHDNNTNNSIQIRNDVIEICIEDDIEIIHSSLDKDTMHKNVEDVKVKVEEHLENDNKSYFKKELHIDSESHEIMDISIDSNEKSDNGYDSRNKNRECITKRISNNLDNTNILLLTKESNFVYSGDQIIKMEDEIQITDDEEEAYLVADKKTAPNVTPIKSKKIKQEPKMRFSDDIEDDIFPYSQLFDIEFKYDIDNKTEIKQECINNVERTEMDVDDEVIVLTDSEDEDNPWLERLSRSQVLNEEKEHSLNEPIVKDEIDLGIWENDGLNIAEIEKPCTSEVSNSTKAPIGYDSTVNKKDEHAKTAGSRNKLDLESYRNRQKRDTELDKKATVFDDVLPIKKQSLPETELTKKSKKVIPIIEALHLPKSRRHDNKDKTDISEKRFLPKLTTKEKKAQKLKEKIDDYLYNKEQKYRRATHKWAADCLPANKTRPLSISKEEKKVIIADRKEKLKKIAEEKKKLIEANVSNKTTKCRVKAKAKISLKNRGDFLVNEQELCASTSNKSSKSLTSSNNQRKVQLTHKTDVRKESVIFDAVTKKSHQEEEIIGDVAMSTQQYLGPRNVLDHQSIKIPKKKDNKVKDSKETNNLEKTCSISKGKQIDNSHKQSANIEISAQDKSISTSVQKENFSPNRIVSDPIRSCIRSDWMKSRSKKRVSFVEKADVKEYEIEPEHSLRRLVGKDAPIPTNKLVRISTIQTECSPKLEEFLLRIFQWNPLWLEQQRYHKILPPVVSASDLQSLRLYYDSFREYYKIALPLLLLEIWYIITKEFEMIERSMQHKTKVCTIVQNSITHIPIPSTNLFLTTLLLEILVKKEDFNKSKYPTYGDLVSFEYAINVENNKQDFQRVFAYVTNVHQMIITDFTHYNRGIKNNIPNPYAVITCTIMTRSLDHVSISMNRVHRIRTIAYLRANIRMVQALQYLPQSSLMNLILHPNIEDYQLPPLNSSHTSSSLVTKDKLNSKQLEAVFRVTETVLKKKATLCFIQGPPGTGKSKVIVNLVTQILYGENMHKNKKVRILLCAPSNAAIDEIVLRLLAIRSTFKQQRFNMVRIGRPESMHPAVKPISSTELARKNLKMVTEKVDYKSATHRLISVEQEKATLLMKKNELENSLMVSQIDDNERRHIKRKIADLTARCEILISGKTIDELDPKERAKYQRIMEDTIVAGANIITSTLSSCYTNQMESIFGGNKDRISVCIVDEATQSCEAETLIPLMLGIDSLVLVGDPNQLPATVLSQQAKKLGLDQSIFSRMQKAFGSQTNSPIIMLDMQYRMAHAISYWPNRYFYGGRLKDANINMKMNFPFYSYRILNHNSSQNDDKFSNTTEAEFVANIIYAMLIFTKWEDTRTTFTLGVLTPYNNQRTIISNKINEKISQIPDKMKKKISFEVNTVDGFQGQERDIIIMSCVRSHGIGFLSDKQRLCVALTRAKYSLILCGNFNTFKKDHMWNALLSDARSRRVLCDIDANANAYTIKPYIIK